MSENKSRQITILFERDYEEFRAFRAIMTDGRASMEIRNAHVLCQQS